MGDDAKKIRAVLTRAADFSTAQRRSFLSEMLQQRTPFLSAAPHFHSRAAGGKYLRKGKDTVRLWAGVRI